MCLDTIYEIKNNESWYIYIYKRVRKPSKAGLIVDNYDLTYKRQWYRIKGTHSTTGVTETSGQAAAPIHSSKANVLMLSGNVDQWSAMDFSVRQNKTWSISDPFVNIRYFNPSILNGSL